MGTLMKALLLLCSVQGGVSFGLAKSELRLTRAPISRFSSSAGEINSGNDTASCKYVDDGVADSKESKELEHNTKYVKGLILTLESLLDKWIITGAMATRRRAYNILRQIERLSIDKDLTLRAERMAKRSGMPMDPPPAMPPAEHIPAVDQAQEEPQTTRIVKPMGAMLSPSSSSSRERKDDAIERLAWERKHKEKSDFMEKMKDNAPRSALSARMAGSAKGGDPLLNGVVEGRAGLDPFSFAKGKKGLEEELSKAQVEVSHKERPAQNSHASAKASEFIARAGSGDAFLGSVLGVGGLDDVLAQIQRRVWIPLAAPPSLLSELGIQPVRGLLLYGSPGCGKTLLARKLGSILSPCRPITIVSGPEILDKFVGSSEKNLREIFDNPPQIYHKYKKNYYGLDKQALHVIVLDEFDAIARRRGGSGGRGDQGDAGVARDSVVNQLLAKMDGVDGLGVPTLLIGLTNKPSLIDPALMRPGRFEVQIEVPKPRTVEQRVAILRVHTESMARNGRVLVRDAPAGSAAWRMLQKRGEEDVPRYDELLDVIAVECDGMSGASLAGVARAAASRALERAVTDFAGHAAGGANVNGVGGAEGGGSISDCIVLQSDFERAVEDVFESARGGDYEELESGSEKSPGKDDSASADAGVNKL